MRKGFVEKLEPLLFDFFEVVFGALGEPASVFEILIRRFESVLDHLQAFDGPHVGRHVIQLVVQRFDFLL